MKPCANPNCSRAGVVLPDDAFAKDKSKPDGLMRICRECNAAKSARWYILREEHKKRKSVEYKAAVAAGTIQPRPLEEPRPPRAEREIAEKIDTEPDDHQFIRFSQGEWLFVLAEADRLGLKPGDYVRNLVRDARRRAG